MTAPLVFEQLGLALAGGRLLDRLDFAVGPGEQVAIVGASGTGKSLIARLALGLLAPGSGRVRLFGADLAGIDPAALRDLRARCGVALQGGSLLGALGVEDNLRLAFGAGARSGAARLRRRIDRLLLDFGLEHLAGRGVRGLSTGEQRRVELARAFLRDPELVMLDEPLEGAAGDAAALEAQILRQTRGRSRALLLLTQDERLAARLATRVLRLERGRVAQQEPMESLPAAMS